MTKHATVITFTSGTQIITKVVDENDTLVILRNPMEMMIDNSDPIVQRIYLSRWLPFSENFVSVVYKTAIESMTLCSDKFSKMYDDKLQAFEASRTRISDPDKTEVFDGMPDVDNEEGSNEEDEGKEPIIYH